VKTITFLPEGEVTTPRGFRAAGVATGVKTNGQRDLALIVSDVPAVAAGVFTTNRVHAYNIDRNRAVLAQSPEAQAIVINSGNANVATGEQGIADTEEIASRAARLLGLSPDLVLTSSTGVIGVPLDMPKIRAGLEQAVAVLSPTGGLAAAEGILTTDTVVKHGAVQFALAQVTVTLGGIAKGAGMIHPQMATMLAYLTTDAAVSPPLLHAALSEAVQASFNCISVDGETSTSDTVLILANGLAGNPAVDDPEGEDYRTFAVALRQLCQHLARAIARDGEGATKLITVAVRGARTVEEARQVARTVAGSVLVKTTLAGNHPNWGRIAAAVGRAGVEISLERMDIVLNGFPVFRDGAPVPFDRETVSDSLRAEKVEIVVDLHQGEAEGTAWGCDMTPEYVEINAEYVT